MALGSLPNGAPRLYLTLCLHFGSILVVMWTPNEICALRQRLKMDQATFAKLLGVDARSVIRWETEAARPSGAAEAVMAGLRETLNKNTGGNDALISFIIGAAAVGGLAYLLVKLLDLLTQKQD